MPGGSSWLHHAESFCPRQFTAKYLASQRQQPSPPTASHKAACLVWIGPDSPVCPVAITIHSKSDLQRQPTQKHLCLNPLCTRFARLSWLTCLTTCLPVIEEEALYASIETHMLPNTCFVWYVMTALYRCLRKTNEEAVPGGLCQLLTIPNHLLFLKQTWCLLWVM